MSFVFLAITVNLLSALLATSAIAFYVFVYTMWLKRTTPQNIVIGGAAGCVPVLVAWAAVTGEVGLPALVLFAMVFYWTPPHFWALALRYRGDYAAANVPMMPVVRGEVETARQIVLYTIVLIAVSLLLLPAAGMGWLYLVSAVVLGGLFLVRRSGSAADAASGRAAISLFRYSITYLTLLFAAVAADALLRSRWPSVDADSITATIAPASPQDPARARAFRGQPRSSRSVRRSSWRIHRTTTSHHRGRKERSPTTHMITPPSCLILERRRPQSRRFVT